MSELNNKIKSDLTDNLNQLISITSHKKQRLQAISNMTKMQREAIEQNDINLLTCYIQEKQRHIDAIDDLDVQFANIYDKGIKNGLAGQPPDNRSPEELQLYGELQAAISQVQEIIKTVYDLEKTNSRRANEIMDDLKHKIRHIQAGKKGHSAYNSTPAFNDGIYIDQKK